MTRRSHLSLLLAFALLTAGLAGCNRDEQPAETTDQARTDAPAPGTATPPGTPPAPGIPPPAPAPETAPGGEPEVAKKIDPEKLPAVVARCNGQEIKKEELVNRAQEMRVQLAQARGVQVPPSSRFYREILEGIIAHKLLLQEAKTLGISITDAEADQMMQAFKSRFPSQEVFQKQLDANKMTEAQLREKMRDDADSKVNKLIQTRIASSVQVTEADARTFYNQNLQRMRTPPQSHLRHILIATPPQASAADRQKAREKAEDLLKQIKNGGDFAQLAAQNSDDPGSKTRGGDLSWVQPGQTVPPFEKAAFALKKPNDLSPVVETRFGYHIIQLVERQDSQVVPFEQAKSRIGAMLRDEKVKETLRAHVEELKSKGKVETYI
jgi:peptidyl-prolyl cis-trans isomerase C